MQKKIIALAVAGLVSGAAFAQSNVTVYGVVDVFGVHAKADTTTTGDQKFNGIQGGGLSGSRLGFKGTEALGNGLNAIFNYEFGTLDPTAATNGITSTRQAFVGLDSKTLGKVTAGRLQGIGYNFDIAYDTMGASAFSPLRTLSTAAGAKITSGTARLANAVAYTSPSFSGFTVNAEYAFNTEDTTNSTMTDAETQWGLSGVYANGPLNVGLAYIGVSNVGDMATGVNEATQKDWALGDSYDFKVVNLLATGVNEATQKDWALGGSYDFKVVKLLASYQQHKNEATTGVKVKDKLWSVGAAIPVGAVGNIHVAYAKIKDDATTELKATSYAIDYQHSLSKRTTAYVGVARVSNGTNATYEYSTASIANVTPTADGNVTLYGAGIRHSF